MKQEVSDIDKQATLKLLPQKIKGGEPKPNQRSMSDDHSLQ